MVSGGLHIHHFWFGIALLAAGGWLGINYNHKEIDMLAAILYGVGGGLIVDEIGLLLTFGDYWSGITWTFFIILLAFVSVLILLGMYRHKVFEEFHEFISKKASLYIAVLLAAIAIAFVAETDNLTITVISTGITIIAVLIVLAHLVLRTKANSPRNPTSNS